MNNKRLQRWLPALAFAGLLAAGIVLPSFVQAQDINSSQNTRQSAINLPVLTLGDWMQSSQEARYSFLIGFANALEMAREWQGYNPLALEQSLNNSWVKGLDNRTIKQISDNITQYISANPQEKDRPLLEYLWYTFAQPKVTEKVSKTKFRQANEIKQERRVSARAN